MKDERNKIDTVSSSTQSPPSASEDINSHWHGVVRRRSFLKGLGMAGATLLPASAHHFQTWSFKNSKTLCKEPSEFATTVNNVPIFFPDPNKSKVK
jgi:hypothetical protein